MQFALNPQVAREMARVLGHLADAIDPPAGQAEVPGPVERPGEFDYSIGDDPEDLRF